MNWMSIKEIFVKVKKHPRNFSYYSGKFKEENNCYIVPIPFLSKGSKAIVTKICDECGTEITSDYRRVLRYRKNGLDYCWECGNNTNQAKLNKSNSHKGFIWTEFSKEKTRMSHTGKTHSEKTIEKIKKSVKKTMISQEWKKWIKKYNIETRSLDAYIKKYGESEGEKLFKRERRCKNPFSLDYWIIKTNGDLDKAKESLSNFQRRDLSYFQKKYGNDEGQIRYDKCNIKKLQNNKNKFSKISQKFISEMIECLDLDKTELYYGKDEWMFYLYKRERTFNQAIFSVDFYDRKNKLIIEFDGTYWHSFKNQKNIDACRDKILTDRGINVLRIKEEDYISNKNYVFEGVKKFYESCKNRP